MSNYRVNTKLYCRVKYVRSHKKSNYLSPDYMCKIATSDGAEFVSLTDFVQRGGGSIDEGNMLKFSQNDECRAELTKDQHVKFICSKKYNRLHSESLNRTLALLMEIPESRLTDDSCSSDESGLEDEINDSPKKKSKITTHVYLSEGSPSIFYDSQ